MVNFEKMRYILICKQAEKFLNFDKTLSGAGGNCYAIMKAVLFLYLTAF